MVSEKQGCPSSLFRPRFLFVGRCLFTKEMVLSSPFLEILFLGEISPVLSPEFLSGVSVTCEILKSSEDSLQVVPPVFARLCVILRGSLFEREFWVKGNHISGVYTIFPGWYLRRRHTTTSRIVSLGNLYTNVSDVSVLSEFPDMLVTLSDSIVGDVEESDPIHE